VNCYADLVEAALESLGKQIFQVKNEADRIANCMRALSFQSGGSRYQVVLLLNNCADDTAMVVKNVALELPMPVHHFEVTLPFKNANAGLERVARFNTLFFRQSSLNSASAFAKRSYALPLIGWPSSAEVPLNTAAASDDIGSRFS
jgi:hypothetical protein